MFLACFTVKHSSSSPWVSASWCVPVSMPASCCARCSGGSPAGFRQWARTRSQTEVAFVSTCENRKDQILTRSGLQYLCEKGFIGVFSDRWWCSGCAQCCCCFFLIGSLRCSYGFSLLSRTEMIVGVVWKFTVKVQRFMGKEIVNICIAMFSKKMSKTRIRNTVLS